LLGTVNVNALCARYNYESYKNGKLETIDISTLYRLGDEGIPYVVKLACSKNVNDAHKAQEYLAQAYMHDYFEDMHYAEGFDAETIRQNNQLHKGFSYFSIPKSRAYDVLYKFLEKNPQFSSYCCSKKQEYYW